ncbi:hypothetical protein ABPG75_011020 [Micractinium tetrahymenae]
MEQQLGLLSIRLTAPEAGLAELAAALPPLSSGSAPAGPEGLEPAQVAAWAQQQRQQPPTALEWAGLHACLSGTHPAGAKACQHLVSLLGWAAEGAAQQLRDAASAQEAASGPADAGNPRHQTALRNTLKLSLAFLACMAKGLESGSSEAAQQQEPAARRGKKAKAGGGGDGKAAAAAAAALASLHLRRDALLALGAIAEALSASSAVLLPAVADMRAAERLLRAAALHCLVHPPAGAAGGTGAATVSFKAAAEACYQAAAGILARPFLAAAAAADERAQPGAAPAVASAAAGAATAALTLEEILRIVSEPKQTQHALAAAARLMSSIAQHSSRAGMVVAARLADRCAELAAAGTTGARASDAAVAAAALAGQRLDACLHFAALLTAASGAAGGAGPSALAAGLLLCLPRLLPLARMGRASTRRLCLDLFSALLTAATQLPAVQPTQAGPQTDSMAAAGALPAAGSAATACQSALLAAICAGLSDKDATLRAKALACLEKHAGLVALLLSSPPSATPTDGSSRGSADVGSELLQALCGRLCDKSPSVSKRAVVLLTALTQQLHARPGAAHNLAPASAAKLAEAVLPVASRLLGLRPDSALHPGEEGLQAISEVVLRLAGRGASAAGLLPLLQLASIVGEAAARAQLQAAVLDALLPGAPSPPTAEQLLCSLAAVLPQCSGEQVRQLREAVHATLAAGASGTTRRAAAAAAAGAAVRLCFQRLHAAACSSAAVPEPAEAAEEAQGGPDLPGSGDGGSSSRQPQSALEASAASLFILGPFSSSDFSTCVAEAGLLLSSLQQLASKSGTAAGEACTAHSLCWLLAALAAAFRQLRLPAADSPAASQDEGQSSWQQHPAAAALELDAPAALQALLLSAAGSCHSVRSGAVEAVLAVPPASQAPLRLLRSLVEACGERGVASSAEALVAGGERQQLQHPQQQVEGTAGGADSGSDASALPSPNAQAQLQALLSLLGLLGAMSADYERQRTAFQRRLAAEAGQPAGVGHLQQQQQHGTSKAGRPLRPASEWWVGDGQGRPDSGGDQQPGHAAGPPSGLAQAAAGAAAAESVAAGEGGGAFDYMRGEDQAAKQEAAAQHFLDSLLAAADTPPACFLPLLERLAGGSSLGEQAEGSAAAAVPACVQAAALRALGRLAVLSEPLCRSAVQLAERCLVPGGRDEICEGSTGSSGPGLEVQQAAVALLADSIDAFPNAFASKLPLVGRLMVPAAVPSAAQAGASQDGCGAASAAAASAAQAEQLARSAAAAYCRLLLRNKLRLQDAGMLAPVGCALAGGSARVAALARHALRQLLLAAPPKDRARLSLDLFHQTPLERGWRRLLAEELVRPSSGLLSEADLRSDVLASQAVQALLAAAAASSTGAGAAPPAADAAPGIAAAGALLRAMRP